MPELNQLYYDLQNYNDATLTTEWINIQNAVNILFSVKVNKDCDLFCEFSKNGDHVIDTNTITKPLVNNQTNEIIVCCLARYVRFSIENYFLPINIITQGFYFETSLLQNKTSNTINQIVDVSNTSFNIDNFPTSFDVDVQNFPTGFDANITNNSLDVNVQNFPTGFDSNITNNSLDVVVTNPITDISINNLPKGVFDGVKTVFDDPQIQYTFNRGTTGKLNTKAYVIPYTDIKTYTNGTNYDLNTSGFAYRLTGGLTDEIALLYGRSFCYQAGIGMNFLFTGSFYQVTKSLNLGCTKQLIGVGSVNLTGDGPENALGFGYWDSDVGYGPSAFGIIYINNNVSQFIKVNDFNNPAGKALALSSDFEKLQVFKVSMQYLGAGNMRFYMIDKITSEYVLLHTIQLAGTITNANLSDPSMCFMMYQHAEKDKSTPINGNDVIASCSFKLAQEGEYRMPYDRFGYDNVTSISANVEKNLLSIRNDATFYSKRNNNSIEIDFLSLSTEGTKVVVVRVWRNRSLTGTPSWVAPYPNSIPVSFDTSGTLGGGGVLLYSIAMAKSDNVQLELSTLHTMLTFGDTLTVSAVSTANSDIVVSLGYHIR